MIKVPLLDLKAQYAKLRDEIEPVIKNIIEEQRFILGKELTDFENNIAQYTGAKFALGVSSGTDAILISLMALNIGHGDYVATTTFSFFATAGCIARVGAKPVFVDIDEETFNIDNNKLEEALKKYSIKAVIPVHLFGQMADMDGLLQLKNKYGFTIIEDAAQSIGAQYKNGGSAGNFGDTGAFSFFPSKNLGGFGDGGLVTTNDERLYEKLHCLRNHGSKVKYYHDYVGGNFRLDNLQAAVLNIKLKYLESWHEGRRKNAEKYEQLFKEKGLLDYVKLPTAIYKSSGVKNYHIYNQFVIGVKDRDLLKKHLIDNGIGCEVYYPLPFHLQKCFEYLGYKKGDFPVAEKASEEVLAIPIYPELTTEQIEYVVERIGSFYKR